jgi:hypothetical protein
MVLFLVVVIVIVVVVSLVVVFLGECRNKNVSSKS